MNLRFAIRNESPGDIASIAYVTDEAFKTLEISNHTLCKCVIGDRSLASLAQQLQTGPIGVAGQKGAIVLERAAPAAQPPSSMIPEKHRVPL